MDNIWFWNDIDDLYCSIAGFVLIISGYFLMKYFWNWWKKVKDRRPSISQSNAIQGFGGGVVFIIVGVMLLYYSLFLPFLELLKR